MEMHEAIELLDAEQIQAVEAEIQALYTYDLIPEKSQTAAIGRNICQYNSLPFLEETRQNYNAMIRACRKAGVHDALRIARLTSAAENLAAGMLAKQWLTPRQYHILVAPFSQTVMPDINSKSDWKPLPPPVKEGWLKTPRQVSYGTAQTVGVSVGTVKSKVATGSSGRRALPPSNPEPSLAELVKAALAESEPETPKSNGMDIVALMKAEQAKKNPLPPPEQIEASFEEKINPEEVEGHVAGGDPDNGVVVRRSLNGYMIYERDTNPAKYVEETTFQTPAEAGGFAAKKRWKIYEHSRYDTSEGVYVRQVLVGFSIWNRNNQRILMTHFETDMKAMMHCIERGWEVLDPDETPPHKPFQPRDDPLYRPNTTAIDTPDGEVIIKDTFHQHADKEPSRAITEIVEKALKTAEKTPEVRQTDITEFTDQLPSSSLENLIVGEGVKIQRQENGEFSILTKVTLTEVQPGFESAVVAMTYIAKMKWRM